MKAGMEASQADKRREGGEREGKKGERDRERERKRLYTISTLINPSCCLRLMRHSFTASSGGSVEGG